MADAGDDGVLSPFDNYLPNGEGVVYRPDRTSIGDDPSTHQVRENVRNEGEHDVIVHGSPDGEPIPGLGHPVHPEQIVQAVLGNPDYVPGTPIRLLACHSGNDVGWAQYIADRLGVPVRAPSNAVGTPRVPNSTAVIRGNGEWVPFTPQTSHDKAAPASPLQEPGQVIEPGIETSPNRRSAFDDPPGWDFMGGDPHQPDSVHALIDEALADHPEIAKVVRELVDDAAHPLDLTRALLDPNRRAATLETLAELASARLLGDRSLADYTAENPGHGPLFEPLPPEVNQLPDGRSRMEAFVSEAKLIDPARQVGAYPTPAERTAVDDYARRLRTAVQPAVRAELARLTEGIDGANTSLRTKSADGIIDKVMRMFEGGENRPPRPNYRVGDAIDAVGARITVESTHELAVLLERIQQHFDTGDHSRILEIENMYAAPKGRNPEYRVIPMVISIEVDGTPYTYELQLTTRRASIAADLNHNTVYKPYVQTTPEQLDSINRMFAEAAALDQHEASPRPEDGPSLPRRAQSDGDSPRPNDEHDGQEADGLPEHLQAIFDSGVDIAGGRAYYTQEDPLLVLAKVAKPNPGFYTLDMHGEPKAVSFGDYSLSPAEAAKLIRADPNWKNQPVWLNSCETGKGKNSFAQQLANELGVRVVGPTELVWAQGDGTSVVSSETFTGSGKPMWKFPPDGKWEKFKPKKGS